MSDTKVETVGLEASTTKVSATTLLALPDQYYEYSGRLSKTTRDRIAKRLGASQHGFTHAGPMICRGYDKCPIRNHCPIPVIVDGKLNSGPKTDYPIDQHCIAELLYLQAHTMALVQKLEVDPLDPIEMPQLNELALVDLYKRRAAQILSQGDRSGQGQDFMLIDVKGYDENGHEAMDTKLHPVALYMESLEKRRDKVLDRFLQTRKHKQEILNRMGSTGESKLLETLQDMREAIEKMSTSETVITSPRLALED